MAKTRKNSKNTIFFKTRTGAIELRPDYKAETIWASQKHIAELFNITIATTNQHIKNIYSEKELSKRATIRKFLIVRLEGKRKILRNLEHYNLDLIISVGYRVNSKTATKFRQWATQILHQHIVDGYTINQSRLTQNKANFLKALEEVRLLLPPDSTLSARSTLDLIKAFAPTWLSLQAYDVERLPKTGKSLGKLDFSPEEIRDAWKKFRQDLVLNHEANPLFGRENEPGVFLALIRDIFQTYAKKDLYPSLEEKAAHLLYFVIKNHPFVDGNKRSAAFVFIFFLSRINLLDEKRLSPEALTALTLLIAESSPQAKTQMIGLVLLILMR